VSPRRSFLLTLAVSCAALGCSGTDSEASKADRAHAGYCAALCERQATCAATAAPPGCRATCENDPGARGTNGDVWALSAACVAGLSCADWERGLAQLDCFALSLQTLAPSDSCIAFCSDDAARSFECGGGYSIMDCVEGPVCAYRDRVLDDANVCNAELDCDVRASCMAGVFGSL
jgi:hypothetical protein